MIEALLQRFGILRIERNDSFVGSPTRLIKLSLMIKENVMYSPH